MSNHLPPFPAPSFRAHAHDMQHIGAFANTVTRRPSGPLPPLDLAELQAEFDRFDGLFLELQKQALVHSAKLSKLFGKLWAGSGNLLKDLFAMNRKLSAEKAEVMREQKRADLMASEAKDSYITELEQVKLENLVARAALRDKEAELEAEERRGAEMFEELHLVGTFIEGRAERLSKRKPRRKKTDGVSTGEGGDGDEKGKTTNPSAYPPAWMREEGTKREGDLYTVSDQVDVLMAQVEHENQRQSKFLLDMDGLIRDYGASLEDIPTASQAPQASPASPEIPASTELQRSFAYPGSSDGATAFASGVVDELAGAAGPHSRDVDLAQTSPDDFEMTSLGISFGLRVLAPRLRPKDATELQLAQYGDLQGTGQGLGGGAPRFGGAFGDSDGSEPFLGGVPFGAKGSTQPPRVREDGLMEGGHMPPCLRDQMTSFPNTMRIPSLATTLKFTLRLYIAKLKYDDECDGRGASHLSLPHFLYFHLCRTYGSEQLADLHASQLQLALLHHRHHRRVQLLAMSLGSYDVTKKEPPLGARDTGIIFKLLAFLRQHEAFTEAGIETRSGSVNVDVNKSVAMAAVRDVFGPLTPDKGASVANRVVVLPEPSESRNTKVGLPYPPPPFLKTRVALELQAA
mmetsp:Transcript_37674/g.84157  ORF Transcript_37674/g.84157 Transcript_37674/m.84157 type:complete len:630 (+) Transcript_37674:141-2030(+)